MPIDRDKAPSETGSLGNPISLQMGDDIEQTSQNQPCPFERNS